MGKHFGENKNKKHSIMLTKMYRIEVNNVNIRAVIPIHIKQVKYIKYIQIFNFLRFRETICFKFTIGQDHVMVIMTEGLLCVFIMDHQ